MLAKYKLIHKMWVILQTQYKGTKAVFNYNIIKLYIKIKYNNYFDLGHFIIVFKKAIKKLMNLDISPPESWHPILFIMALFNIWPI